MPYGVFGTITGIDYGPTDVPDGSRIEIAAKGKTVGRSFDHKQIEDCCLRVRGEVLSSIIDMVDEVSASCELFAELSYVAAPAPPTACGTPHCHHLRVRTGH